MNATPGVGKVDLTWDAPASDGGNAITGYRVEYKANADTDWTVKSASQTDRNITIDGLGNATAYSFRVTAINAAGVLAFQASGMLEQVITHAFAHTCTHTSAHTHTHTHANTHATHARTHTYTSHHTTQLNTDIASASAPTAVLALEAIKALCEGVDQWIEPFIVNTLTGILDCLAVPKTAEAAMSAGEGMF
jgi:glutamate dehydrogenase/leucine dehydrogenase